MRRYVTLVDGHGRQHCVTLASYVTIWQTVKHVAAREPSERVDGMTAGAWLRELRRSLHIRINEGIPWQRRGLLESDGVMVDPRELARGDVIMLYGHSYEVSRVRITDERGVLVRERGNTTSWGVLPFARTVLLVGSWDVSTGVVTMRMRERV